MATDELHLGLDFGTESVRALLVGGDGAVAATATAGYRSGQLVRGSDPAAARFAEPLGPATALQDADDWLVAAAEAVRSATGALGPGGADRVRSVGLDATSCTVLPTTADGTPLSRGALAGHPHAWAKLWKHHGAAAQAELLTEVARERGEPWLARYGGVVGLEWFFPKVLEVVDEDPAVVEAADVWVEAGDWLVWQLTGALVRSTCQAGYKAQWSPADGYPSTDYLKACSPDLAVVAADRLPGRFAAPGECAGALTAEAAARLGLPAGTAVSAAVIDAHAGVPGVGVAEHGTLVLVLGTSGCHMLLAPDERPVPGVAGVVADGILPGSYGYETGQAAVGDAFEWVRRLTGSPSHDALVAAARDVPPGADGLTVVDWFNGCRTPLMDGRRTGAVLGAGLHHGAAHLYRATLEASAFGLAWIVDTLRTGGVEVDRFVATGGLTTNRLFLEITAAVLDAPVDVPHVEHGSALGAAVLGAAAAGRFADAREAVASMTGPAAGWPPPDVVTPEPATVAAYRPAYDRYRDLTAALPSIT